MGFLLSNTHLLSSIFSLWQKQDVNCAAHIVYSAEWLSVSYDTGRGHLWDDQRLITSKCQTDQDVIVQDVCGAIGCVGVEVGIYNVFV